MSFDKAELIKNLNEINANFVEIDKLCEKCKSDSNYVYKSCVDISDMLPKEYKVINGELKCSWKETKKITNFLETRERKWLVVMQKLDDTKTNENRKDVENKYFAKFRADKLRVIKIINIYEPTITKKSIINALDNYRQVFVTEYKVGEIVYPNEFDTRIDETCSGGIHYFKTLIPAYFYRRKPEDFKGTWIAFYENGGFFQTS